MFVEQETREGLRYTDCPECGKQDKLMVGPADEGGYWYKCLSVGCATFGTTESTVHPGKSKEVPKKTGRTIWPPYQDGSRFKPEVPQEYVNRYGPGADACAGSMGDYGVLPIYDWHRQKRGYMLRVTKKNEGRGPKSLMRPYYDMPVPMQSWYLPEEHTAKYWNTLVVVEDQFSAAAMGTYLPAVALLGTSVSTEGIEEIIKAKAVYEIPNVAILLDADANATSLKIARNIPGAVPIPMFEEDYKDMSPTKQRRMVELLRGLDGG